MGALRKAGVWLGLVEEDDRHEGSVLDDEYADYDDDYTEPARPRSLVRPRAGDRRGDAYQRDVGRASRGRDPYERDRSVRDQHPQSRGGGLFDHDPRIGADGGTTDDDAVGRFGNGRVSSDRAGSDRIGSDRVGASRLGTERVATERGGSERIGTERVGADRGGIDGGTVRHLARPGGKTINFPTQENLALAPQVQLNERAVVGEQQTGQRLQITTLHPTSYSDARAIGEHFRDGRPVIINLTELDEADAKRLVDFAAGLAFGLRGGMDRVTNRVFLLTPANVEVSAEDKARIAEGRFFDQG